MFVTTKINCIQVFEKVKVVGVTKAVALFAEVHWKIDSSN